MAQERQHAGVSRGGVTRNDVARYAGVSTAVVSFVVNNGPKPVSEATAARVRDAIATLGYRPNRTARALALGSTNTLGLVVPDNTNPFYAEYTHAIQLAAADRGYALVMTNTGIDPDAELQAILDLGDRQIDGLILARATAVSRLAELVSRGLQTPTVLIDATAPFPGQDTVGPDAMAGVSTAVDHLLGVHGHRNVALIMGDVVEAATDGREAGWMHAHAQLGRPLGVLQRGAFSREGGYTAGLELLRRPDRPTAVITSSDLQAVGLLRAAFERGIGVPDDLAVVSFDGTDETAYTQPALTTVRQPTSLMATEAVETVLAPGRPAHRTFPMELIIRRSCGCRSV